MAKLTYHGLVATLIAVLVSLMIVGCASGDYLRSYSKGDEEEVLGQTFDEEMWYTTVTEETDEGEAEFGISYLNMGDIQAFLVAFESIENDDGEKGVLPYQMFGMHYYTEDGEEVYMGAILAYLTIFNDTDEDGMPDADEEFLYVVPFGLGNVLEEEYTPNVENMGVVKVDEGHYRMGITYKNLYAIATANPIMTALLATGFVFKFSELTITYEIKVDMETGTMTSETFYTIGEISELYAVILGFPFEAQDVHGTIPDNYCIGVVHFSTMFTSNYEISDVDGLVDFENDIFYPDIEDDDYSSLIDNYDDYSDHNYGDRTTGTTRSDPYSDYEDYEDYGDVNESEYQDMIGDAMGEVDRALETSDINIDIGDSTAFEIDFYGTYDVIDEDDNDKVLEKDAVANSVILNPGLNDIIMVGWQLGFSAGIMSYMAYALSDDVQDSYTSPMDLHDRSLDPSNPAGFGAQTFWYAVTFPGWDGHRVVHDPAYTAFFGDDASGQEGETSPGMTFGVLAIAGTITAIMVAVYRRRSKKT